MPMYHSRLVELVGRYCGYFGRESDSLASLQKAEKIASGYAIANDDWQPVDDETLSADIDEMRATIAEWSRPLAIS